MARDIFKLVFSLIGLLALLFFSAWLKINYTQTEIYDDNLNFKAEFIKDNHVDFTIDSVKKYREGKSTIYYVFTDIGRLRIDNEDSIFDSALYYDIKDEQMNKQCTGKVYKLKYQKDWRLQSINCS